MERYPNIADFAMDLQPRLGYGRAKHKMELLLDDTTKFWRDWVHRGTYTGRWREMAARSAITLKLMTYAPSGAPVAAVTAWH